MTRAALAFAVVSLAFSAGDDLPTVPAEDFARFRAEIFPQPGESPWRDVAWLTSVREARERSIAEDKPIVIFTAADGSPLSRT